MTKQQTHPLYRPDIDGLRAVAVIAVVMFHAFPHTVHGFIGVDMFFVISGYLITTILLGNMQRGQLGIMEFYRRRVRRIFPALTVVLGVCLVFGWVALLADEYRQLGKHTAAGAAFVLNLVVWQESGYFDTMAITKPLLHLWSLGIEEQFYILWPPVLWVTWKCRVKPLWVALFGVLLSSAACIYLSQTDSVAAFYAPYSRMWQLLVGAGLASHKLTLREAHAGWLSVIALVLLVVAFVVISPARHYPGMWAWLPTAATACFIAAGPQAWVNRSVLAQRPLVAIGLISYPLYLWHWPLLSFDSIILSGAPNKATRWLLIGVSLVLAWATYRFIEKPVRYGAKGKRMVPLLVALMLVIAAAGWVIYHSEGFPRRANVEGRQSNLDGFENDTLYDGGCLERLQLNKRLSDYCRFSDTGGARTIAVIGDSHAYYAYPGITELARAHGINTLLLGISGHPPFPGTVWGSTQAQKDKIHDQIDAILKSVAAQRDVHTVFIFSRGVVNITGTGIGVERSDEKREPNIPPPLFLHGLQAAIDQLHAAGKEVYYVTENPETGMEPLRCVSRPLRPQEGDCHLTRAEVEQRQAPYLTLLHHLHNVTVVQTIPGFCPGTDCQIAVEGKLLYFDDNHLSRAGSHFQATHVLAPYIK